MDGMGRHVPSIMVLTANGYNFFLYRHMRILRDLGQLKSNMEYYWMMNTRDYSCRVRHWLKPAVNSTKCSCRVQWDCTQPPHPLLAAVIVRDVPTRPRGVRHECRPRLRLPRRGLPAAQAAAARLLQLLERAGLLLDHLPPVPGHGHVLRVHRIDRRPVPTAPPGGQRRPLSLTARRRRSARPVWGAGRREKVSGDRRRR